ncbi:DEAD/DEAH box helicase family protein [bacterium]|nr:DEAD/DEAH box helicase family protein [bacterium]
MTNSNLEELERLKNENKLLRQLLGLAPDEILLSKQGLIINQQSAVKDKIDLFCSLFKGRQDIFAQRWENGDRSGYSPVCLNRWDKEKCNLPPMKCGSCPNRELKAIDKAVIYNHLAGNIVIGIYPILENDKCCFLAIDFDKRKWKNDIKAVHLTCRKLEIPSSIEISRSGNGAHLWIFFSEEVPAIVARKLGTHIISETRKSGKLLDLESYDRMFPNQDYLPEGGFGNLIALPLQKRARLNNCAVFVSESLEAFQDQWAYLSTIKKLKLKDIEEIISKNKLDPPVSYLSKKRVARVIFANQIFISKRGVPQNLQYKLQQLAVFPNPAYFIAQASRRSTKQIPRFINCSENLPEVISLPSGLINKIVEILDNDGIKYSIDDQRNKGYLLNCSFHGTLREKQEEALQEIIKHDMSILCASTGFGKTILAIKLICERKVNTLILVHRKEILEQWKDKLSIYMTGVEVGYLGASKNKISNQIDIAMIQTLKNFSAERIDHYGQIIFDECHHIAAYTFEKILKQSRAKYMLGMTATPVRKDGLHPIVYMQCGDIKYRSSIKLNFGSMNVFVRELKFQQPVINSSLPAQIKSLTQDETRNKVIISDIIEAFNREKKILVLTERVSHLTPLHYELTKYCKNIIVLEGKI